VVQVVHVIRVPRELPNELDLLIQQSKPLAVGSTASCRSTSIMLYFQ
jgi:hypothetical protein